MAAEAADLTRVIDSCLTVPWNPPTTARVTQLRIGATTYGGIAAAPPTIDLLAPLLAFAIPLLLWVFGIIYIIFRRKKLLREAESADKPILA